MNELLEVPDLAQAGIGKTALYFFYRILPFCVRNALAGCGFFPTCRQRRSFQN
jgi:hypothetical protein